MQCKNHPHAPAIENCARCATPLCGICARFTDSGIYCEPCAAALESERRVAEKSSKLNEQTQPVTILQADEDTEVIRRRKKSNPARWQIPAILLCAGVITARVYFLLNPPPVPADPQFQVLQQTITSKVQCLLVFRQIGVMLSAGQTPDPALHCAQPDAPNIISRSGDVVRVSHPDPQLYGWRALYVSSDNPDPVFQE